MMSPLVILPCVRNNSRIRINCSHQIYANPPDSSRENGTDRFNTGARRKQEQAHNSSWEDKRTADDKKLEEALLRIKQNRKGKDEDIDEEDGASSAMVSEGAASSSKAAKPKAPRGKKAAMKRQSSSKSVDKVAKGPEVVAKIEQEDVVMGEGGPGPEGEKAAMKRQSSSKGKEVGEVVKGLEVVAEIENSIQEEEVGVISGGPVKAATATPQSPVKAGGSAAGEPAAPVKREEGQEETSSKRPTPVPGKTGAPSLFDFMPRKDGGGGDLPDPKRRRRG